MLLIKITILSLFIIALVFGCLFLHYYQKYRAKCEDNIKITERYDKVKNEKYQVEKAFTSIWLQDTEFNVEPTNLYPEGYFIRATIKVPIDVNESTYKEYSVNIAHVKMTDANKNTRSAAKKKAQDICDGLNFVAKNYFKLNNTAGNNE